MTSHQDITRFKKQPCPHCGKPLDAAGPPTAEPSRPPTDGDFLICFGCAEPSIFQTGPLGVYLRKPTAGELAEFAREHGQHAARLRAFLNGRSGPAPGQP